MLLGVRHDTSYSYDGVAAQMVQVLRLTPRSDAGQEVLDWSIVRSDGAAMSAFVDGLGNISSLSSRRGPTSDVVISVSGRVRTSAGDGVVRGTVEPLPPVYFLRRTPTTGPADAIRALAQESMKGETGRGALEALEAEVRARMAHVPGAPHVEVTAEGALAAGRGSAKDLAHVFIAAARAAGVPARYVGGYVWTAEPAPFAARAWAETWLPDVGWIGFDPAGGAWSTETHVRVAVGLDHRQGAPISGLWRGEGSEKMSVAGSVETIGAAQ